MKIDLYSAVLVLRRWVRVAVFPVPGAPETYMEPGFPDTKWVSSHWDIVFTCCSLHKRWLGVPVWRAALAD